VTQALSLRFLRQYAARVCSCYRAPITLVPEYGTRTRVLEYRGLLGGSSVPEVAIRGGWDGMGWGVSLLLWMDREGEYRGEVYFIFRVCMLVGLS